MQILIGEAIIHSITGPVLDIKKYVVDFHRGDGIVAADTTWYTFILNNETEVRFTLFHFGKKQELEIKNSLSKFINK